MPLQKRFPSTRKLVTLSKQLWLERFARKPFDTKLLKKIQKIELEASRRERSVYRLEIEKGKMLFIKAFGKFHPDMKKHFKAQNLFWRIYLNKFKGQARHFELKPLKKFFATNEFFVAEYLDKPTIAEVFDFLLGSAGIKDKKLEEQLARIGTESALENLFRAVKELKDVSWEIGRELGKYTEILKTRAEIDFNQGNYLVNSFNETAGKFVFIPIDPVVELVP